MREQETVPEIVVAIKNFVRSRNINELKAKCLYQPDYGVVCTLTARLILEEAKRLGASGRLYDLDIFEVGTPQAAGHTYVVLEGMKNKDRALNMMRGHEKTVDEAKNGRDVTSEIMNSPWQSLL